MVVTKDDKFSGRRNHGHGIEDGQLCVKETGEQILNALQRQQTVEKLLKNVVR